MANSVNKVILVGNVGKDPEVRSTTDGKEIAVFSIATTDTWKDKSTGEKKEKTEWHRVVVFNEGLVGVIKRYLKRGSRVYIEGSLQTRKWSDNAGQEKYSTEVVLQNFNSNLVLLDSKPTNTTYDSNASNMSDFGDNNTHDFDPNLDDIPF